MSTHTVITISRESGSGGRRIGKLLAEKLGWNLYDKEILEMAGEKEGYTREQVGDMEHAHTSVPGMAFNSVFGARGKVQALNDELFSTESRMIREIADKENAVIVGRCADMALEGYARTVNIFIQGSRDRRIARVMKRESLSAEDAEKRMDTIDRTRASYCNYYAGSARWGRRENYDLVINSDIGEEKTAGILCDYVTALLAVTENT